MTYKKLKVLSFCIHYIYKLRIPIKSNRMREAYVIRTSKIKYELMCIHLMADVL